jgi:hypothetical protein
MAIKPHDYGADGGCNRCSHDSFSSYSYGCEENPKKILDRRLGMVENPKYQAPTVWERLDKDLSDTKE